ncbi:MAG: hypothetical protein N2559_12385, partial [Anaerolineae bacterium]|nr:hypothetical protein [Anaerolineae bacterium]
VGFFRGDMHWIGRALLVVIACIMVLDPIDLSVQGVLPVLIALAIIGYNYFAYRRKAVTTT